MASSCITTLLRVLTLKACTPLLQAGVPNLAGNARGAGRHERRLAQRQTSSFRGHKKNNGVIETNTMLGPKQDLDLTEIFCDTVLSSPLTPLPSLLLM